MSEESAISFFRGEVVQLLTSVTKLTSEQVDSLIEERFDENYEFSLTMPKIRKFKIQGDPAEVAEEWKSKIETNEYITNVDVVTFGEGKKAVIYLVFQCDRQKFFSKVLSEVFEKKEKYGSSQQYSGQTYLFEFSSPNIAKPFHAGHLRSTVIGNCLKNMFAFLGANAVSINYLGDWGTQYGILAVGFKKYGDEKKLEEDPIRHLFDVYVKTNEAMKEDLQVREEAKSLFSRMEQGDEEVLALWRRFRELSIVEYKKTYKRLNIEFDVYSGESFQSEGMEEAFKILVEKNIGSLVFKQKGTGNKRDKKGSKEAPKEVEAPKEEKNIEEVNDAEGKEGEKVYLVDLTKYKLDHCVVKKGDGSSLYITRDISAAVARYREYSFAKSIYVVGSAQDLHFKQLFKILELMGYDWAKNCEHVNFGMVLGMSTRSGNVVFLENILDGAKQIMLDRIKENKMGKLSEIENPEEVADIIGISAIVVQDCNAKRIKDYAYQEERMSSIEGHTGPYLQYAHARLCSMEDKTKDVPITDDVDYSLLKEPQAIQLAQQISRFQLVLQSAALTREPSVLVAYLFDLAHAISAAHTTLRVKGEEINLSKARKLLFWSSKIVLRNALQILGLTPLTRM